MAKQYQVKVENLKKYLDKPSESASTQAESSQVSDSESHSSTNELAEEALKVHKMFNEVPSKVEPGSKWFFISTSWMDKWKKYVSYHKLEGQPDATPESERVHPGKINCEDITLKFDKTYLVDK
jgi:hypothetical protein